MYEACNIERANQILRDRNSSYKPSWSYYVWKKGESEKNLLKNIRVAKLFDANVKKWLKSHLVIKIKEWRKPVIKHFLV